MKPVEAADDAIVEEIVINGPATRAFDALTHPEELVKWWGVEGKFQAVRLESDLRPGGKWRIAAAGTQRDRGSGRPQTLRPRQG